MANATFTTAELIRQVEQYALDNYEKGGWDVIVECYDDEMIADIIGRARTIDGAIKKFKGIVSVYADRQADAINSAF
jgi:nitrate reductase NapAB chaperone NapD